MFFGYAPCDTQFNITYFDIYVGAEYNFTGNSGYIKYSQFDTYGNLYGTGDWSYMRSSIDDNTGDFATYEDWLAFELPTVFIWDSQVEQREIIANDSLLEYVPTISFSLEQVGSVPVPAAVWLFGSGLVGLIGLARRKA